MPFRTVACMLMALFANQSRAQDPAWFLADAGLKGGFVVDVGCGAGRETTALRVNDRILVHGLDADAANVAAARAWAIEKNVAGAVCFDRFGGTTLPYIDNLVNLLVDRHDGLAADERLRVLVPGGVAFVRRGGQWIKIVKPVPREIDEWTHFLHGPNNNAIAADLVVDTPRQLQWVNDPTHARSHEHFQTVSASVSAGGRFFSILDEGPTIAVALPAKNVLVARDAFNGVELWRKPIGQWESHLRLFRGGPAWIARRLVAVKDRVYVTLGYDQPVTALDAATGDTLTTFAGTEQTSEIVVDRGVLYVVVSDPEAKAARDKAKRFGKELPPTDQKLAAFDALTGKRLWTRDDDDAHDVMPTTLAVVGGRVFYQNPKAVVCLDASTGKTRWSQPRATGKNVLSDVPPTLVVAGDVALSADPAAPPPPPDPDEVKPTRSNDVPNDPGELVALSVDDGKLLWRSRCYANFHSPVDVLVADGLVWTAQLWSVRNMGVTSGRDLHTGKIVRKRPPDDPNKIVVSHHRCHRIRGTERFLVLSRGGVDILDVKSGEMKLNHWVRGTCQHGPIPCNGLVYAPPHSCGCYPEAMIHGFTALASQRAAAKSDEPRLEKGPAFDAVPPVLAPRAPTDDWPTYRGDMARSGMTAANVEPNLEQKWTHAIGGRLSPPTQAEGKVFVSAIDAHAIHALDANTGRPAWTFTAGGRVDSPPTVAAGRVYFGSVDGWVYCLRSTDGVLVWRFRAAPTDRRLVAYGRLESVWPVHGSVLVHRGFVYCAAGRSSFLDGGISTFKLDAATGQQLATQTIDSRDPATGLQGDVISGFEMPGLLNDVLAADAEHVFIRHAVFDLDGKSLKKKVPHLFSPTGFLDSSGWHRSYWLIGPEMHGGFRDWARASDEVPHGNLFCLSEGTVYGFGRTKASRWVSHVGIEDTHFELSAIKAEPEDWQAWTRPPEAYKSAVRMRWNRKMPTLVRAMTLAGKTLFVAGPPDWLKQKDADAAAALAGQKGGALHAVSTADGSTLASLPLTSPPVFDGIAAANSRLYLATMDGRVVCFGNAR